MPQGVIMPRFRNRTSERLFVPDVNKTVTPDEVVDVPGDLAGETDDTYLVSGPQGDRAWPKANWADATPARRTNVKDEE